MRWWWGHAHDLPFSFTFPPYIFPTIPSTFLNWFTSPLGVNFPSLQSSSLHLLHSHPIVSPLNNNMNNIRNGYREEKSFCYFHPKQVLVGVCPLCLNERLLILFAKQGRHHNRSSSSSISSHRLQSNSRHRKPPSSSIHKIFAFGSLFTRPESHHNYDYDDVSPTPEGNNTFQFIIL